MDENLDLSKNADIKEALREFEEKSKTEQAQKAPEVLQVSKIPKMTVLVMKWFKIEQRPAEYVLLGFAILVILFSLFLIFKGTGKVENGGDIQVLPAEAFVR
jgi:hypothetical protein